MGFDLRIFKDQQLEADYIEWLVDERSIDIQTHFAKLWEYYTDRMYDISNLKSQISGYSGRCYLQAQEYGLPARITGQKLTRKLAAAGAVDLETAVLIAKARIKGVVNLTHLDFIATSGAAYAVIAAIKEYTEIFAVKKIKEAKEHLQNTNPEKSGNEELYSQACSNNNWGMRFAWFYRASFFAPIIIFSILVTIITFIVYQKGGPNTEIITEESWPTYKAMLFWVPISYVVFIVLGLIGIGVMIIFFRFLKNKSKIARGKPKTVVSKTTQPRQAEQ